MTLICRTDARETYGRPGPTYFIFGVCPGTDMLHFCFPSRKCKVLTYNNGLVYVKKWHSSPPDPVGQTGYSAFILIKNRGVLIQSERPVLRRKTISIQRIRACFSSYHTKRDRYSKGLRTRMLRDTFGSRMIYPSAVSLLM